MNDQSQHFGQVIKTLRTKSAANPALLFALVCLMGGVPGALLASYPMNIFFATICAVGVLIAAFQIIYFTFADPDRLQDEKHVENKMIINAMHPMIGDASQVIEISSNAQLTGNTQIEVSKDV